MLELGNNIIFATHLWHICEEKAKTGKETQEIQTSLCHRPANSGWATLDYFRLTDDIFSQQDTEAAGACYASL